MQKSPYEVSADYLFFRRVDRRRDNLDPHFAPARRRLGYLDHLDAVAGRPHHSHCFGQGARPFLLALHAAKYPGCFANLDQVPIRVAYVGADFGAPIPGVSQKLDAMLPKPLARGFDVGYPNIEE